MDDFRYRVYQGAAGTAAVFLSGAEAKGANQRFLIGACAVLLGGSLVALLLAVLFSRQAVRPTAEAYEKQKRFITDASHALKTPLTLLQADLEILESEQGAGPVAQGYAGGGVQHDGAGGAAGGPVPDG